MKAGAAAGGVCLWPANLLPPHSHEALVEKIDTFELFAMGFAINALGELKAPTPGLGGAMPKWSAAGFAMVLAKGQLEKFLDTNVLNLEASIDAGRDLLK